MLLKVVVGCVCLRWRLEFICLFALLSVWKVVYGCWFTGLVVCWLLFVCMPQRWCVAVLSCSWEAGGEQLCLSVFFAAPFSFPKAKILMKRYILTVYTKISSDS